LPGDAWTVGADRIGFLVFPLLRHFASNSFLAPNGVHPRAGHLFAGPFRVWRLSEPFLPKKGRCESFVGKKCHLPLGDEFGPKSAKGLLLRGDANLLSDNRFFADKRLYPPLPPFEKAAFHGFPASEPLGNEDRALECASRSKETAEDQKRRLQRPIARKCSRSESAKAAVSSASDQF